MSSSSIIGLLCVMYCSAMIGPSHLLLVIYSLVICSLTTQELGVQSATTNSPSEDIISYDCPVSCYCYEENDDVIAHCTGSDLHRVPIDLPVETTFLDISDTNISMLRNTDLNYLQKLRHVSITYNSHLSIIEDKALSNNMLTKIELYGNNLLSFGSYSLGQMNEVSELDLQSNSDLKLEAGFFLSFQSLERLHLGDTSMSFNETLFQNQATAVYKETTSLKYLNLEYKNITRLRESVLRNLPNLEIIYVGYNHITYIDDKMLSSNARLREIHLEWNGLTSIHPSAFSTQNELQYLDLSGNSLTTLGQGMLDFMPPISGICLSFNCLSCGCDIIWLREWMLQLGRTNCIPYSFTKCQEPAELRAKALTDITEDSICPVGSQSSTSKPVVWISLALLFLLMIIFIGCLVLVIFITKRNTRKNIKKTSTCSQATIVSTKMSSLSTDDYI